MNQKNIYIKPIIECFTIDTNISLAMLSDGGGGPPGVMANPAKEQKNPFETNPFNQPTKKK